jgi:transcriptional regulator with XRE-family HTH domain
MPTGKKIDEARVRQLLAQGLTQKQVSLRLGYSKSAVCRIANEKSEVAR